MASANSNLTFMQRWWPTREKKTIIDKTPVTAESESDSSSYSGSTKTHTKPTILSRLWTPLSPLWKSFKKSAPPASTKAPESDKAPSSELPTPTDEDGSTPRRTSSTHDITPETPDTPTAIMKPISPRPTNATLTGAITDTASAIARRALTLPAVGRTHMKTHCPRHKARAPPPTSAEAMHSSPAHHQHHKSETGSSSVDSSVDSIYEGISGRAASVRSLRFADARSMKSTDTRPCQPYRARSWANMRVVPGRQQLRGLRDSLTPMAITGHGDGEYRRHIADLLAQANAEKALRTQPRDSEKSATHDDASSSSSIPIKKLDKGKGKAVEIGQQDWDEFLRQKNQEVLGMVREKSHERTWSTETGYTEERDTDKLSVRTYSGVAQPRGSMALDGFGLTGMGYNGTGRSKLERRRSSRSEV